MKLVNVDVSMENVERVKNSLDPIDAQDSVTLAHFNKYAYKTTTVSVAQSSTVVAPANITQLTTVSLPIGSYNFKATIKIRSAAAATGYGLRFQAAGATVSSILAQWRLPANADFSTTHNIIYDQRDQTINNVAGTIGAANTDYCAIGEGTFTVTAAGAVTIQVRSETAGTAVTVGIGSNLEVRLIS